MIRKQTVSLILAAAPTLLVSQAMENMNAGSMNADLWEPFHN